MKFQRLDSDAEAILSKFAESEKKALDLVAKSASRGAPKVGGIVVFRRGGFGRLISIEEIY